MSNNEIDNFLLGGGGASARFENIGDSITGKVVSAEVRDQTDIQTGKVLTWDNGDVRKQLVVTLATSLREDADDDGHRAVYVKGSKKAGSQSLHDAVASAVRAAGAKSLEAGGTLTVTYIAEEPSQTRGFNPRKLYSASYVAPDKAAQAAGFLAPAPVAAPAAPVAQPAPAPQAAPLPDPAALAAYQAWAAQQAQQQGA